MVILFPSFPSRPNVPDESFGWEASAASKAGFKIALWEGRATAAEIAAVLWPIDPHTLVNYPDLKSFSMNGLTPAQWVAHVLDHEAKPCQFGGAGRITREERCFVPAVYSIPLTTLKALMEKLGPSI